eukprot:365418-Chlamydomonas_euryale.AAC.6
MAISTRAQPVEQAVEASDPSHCTRNAKTQVSAPGFKIQAKLQQGQEQSLQKSGSRCIHCVKMMNSWVPDASTAAAAHKMHVFVQLDK